VLLYTNSELSEKEIKKKISFTIATKISRKIFKQKRTGGMAQVLEQLPSKLQALSSNPSTKKINE
jgi:hypothetical protein